MRGGSSFAALKDRLPFLSAAVLTVTALGIAAPVQAGRGISIDANTTEIVSDVTQGFVGFGFPINDGGTQLLGANVNLPEDFGVTEGGQTFAAVGLTVANPNDLFATVSGSDGAFPPQAPALRLGFTTDAFGTPGQIVMFGPSDGRDVSDASNPLIASVFDFGNLTNTEMSASELESMPGSSCESDGSMLDCYGPFTDSAIFQFIDLSATGSPGDFELRLTCENLCGNIGFNLDGVSFSADDFNPNGPLPPQLVSFSLGDQTDLFHPGTWDFIFRNAAAVPEPGTWASMLLGFGLLGGVLRRQRKLRLQTS
jgi:hypothetical protein